MEAPLDFYRTEIAEVDRHLDFVQRRDRQLSHARGWVFLLSFGLFLGWATGFGTWLLMSSIVVFSAFVAVLTYHEQVQRTLKREQTRRAILASQVARIGRDWESLGTETHQPRNVVAAKIQQSEFVLDEVVVSDLDLFGAGSLWSLVNQAITPWGQLTLHRWLRNPAAPEEVALRHAAVQWLVNRPKFCLDLYLNGRLLADLRDNNTEFVAWAEGPIWSRDHQVQIWIFRAFAVAITSVIVGLILGWLMPGWVLVAMGLFVANVVCNMLWIGNVHDRFNQISSGKYDLQYFIELFRAVDSLPDELPRLAQLKSKMTTGEVTFEMSLGKLRRILAFANGRKAGLLAVPWLVVQILWFWDFHVLLWLEQWQSRFGPHVRHWFEAVGELEAMASLATLSHDHPQWAFPTVDYGESKLSAKAMGHVLLPPDRCVTNDVQIGPRGSFLLVTGSNMSGKSTLLRAVGINTLLAMAGGPVCAAEFRLPPVEIATSMRVTDSLNSGVSFFMAELQRVKLIVDRAQQLHQSNAPCLLYLLDEILQGTNSAERHVAVTRILQHLLHTRALGAISTHDLELASATELQKYHQLVHLRETIEQTADGERMRFDYVLHDGVTPTTNALRLLDMVGLKAFDQQGMAAPFEE